MSVLVVAEHDNVELKPATRVALSAAALIGGDIDVLVVGSGLADVSAQAAAVPGVSKVIVADNAVYEHQLPENITPLVVEAGQGYSHILAAHTTNGKNYLPQVAALMGVAMISDIIAVDSADTFKRPIYAGNAIARLNQTIRSKSFQCAEPPMIQHPRQAAAPPSKPWVLLTAPATHNL